MYDKKLPRPGIEPGTFRSSVWRSPNWAIAALQVCYLSTQITERAIPSQQPPQTMVERRCAATHHPSPSGWQRCLQRTGDCRALWAHSCVQKKKLGCRALRCFSGCPCHAEWRRWGSSPRPHGMAPWATALDRSATLSLLRHCTHGADSLCLFSTIGKAQINIEKCEAGWFSSFFNTRTCIVLFERKIT